MKVSYFETGRYQAPGGDDVATVRIVDAAFVWSRPMTRPLARSKCPAKSWRGHVAHCAGLGRVEPAQNPPSLYVGLLDECRGPTGWIEGLL
jgi:hypothetical protein